MLLHELGAGDCLGAGEETHPAEGGLDHVPWEELTAGNPSSCVISIHSRALATVPFRTVYVTSRVAWNFQSL
jgi:hypothetical protein